MLSSDDWASMAADMGEVRGDNEISIVIRRGETVLASQDVRITMGGGSAHVAQGRQTEESAKPVLIFGPPALDIQSGDRFNDGGGVLYTVVLVRPNRRIGTSAEARIGQ